MSFDLKPFNTFHMSAYSRQGVILDDLSKLSLYLDDIQNHEMPFIVLGEGSDVLFLNDFEGLVIINRLKGIVVSEDQDFYYVSAMAGEILDELIQLLLNKGIFGLENLAKIPGTVGGAPVQNVGAYGVSFSDFCRYVEVLDIEKRILTRLSNNECCFGYRTSIFKKSTKYIITSVGLKFPKKWTPNLGYESLSKLELLSAKDIYEFVSKLRKEKLPDYKVLGNAGSFFKNPKISANKLNSLLIKYPNLKYYNDEHDTYKVSAAWMIEKSGCKGIRCGGAGVYDKHALIIVNHGNANSSDMKKLIKTVIRKVYENFDITLEPEVIIIGSLND